MRPVLVPAEMAGRELMRRRTALALLTALPLAFYAAHASDGPEAIEVGGLTMAFSISGAAIFTVISARRVDRRLALASYRSWQLMLGRRRGADTAGRRGGYSSSRPVSHCRQRQ